MERKGTLILTEGRSGSNWLGSLSNGTGQLGKSKEWLDKQYLGVKVGSLPFDALVERIITLSSTPNRYFCVKLFPRYLFDVQNRYGLDLILEMQKRFDTQLLMLRRRDRIAQAVSFAKAYQSKKWTSTATEVKDPQYNFDLICRCLFHIERAYGFWDSYISARSLDVVAFQYEDLLNVPDRFVEALAAHANVTDYEIPESNLAIQRDGVSIQWRERFIEEMKDKNILSHSIPRQPPVTTSNLSKFLRKRPIRPLPFTV